MRYREQNNKNNRNQEIFEVGPDHIGKQGRVGSSLYRPRVGLFWVFKFFGGCKEVSEGLGNCRDASGNCLGSLGKLLRKSWEVSGSALEPQEGYGTCLSLVSNVLRVLWDVTPVHPESVHMQPSISTFQSKTSLLQSSHSYPPIPSMSKTNLP